MIAGTSTCQPDLAPQQRAHPDFHSALVRGDSCGRGLTGSGSKEAGPLNRSGASRRRGPSLFSDSARRRWLVLVRKFNGHVQLPRAVPRGVGTAAGVVIGKARGDVVGETDVGSLRRATSACNHELRLVAQTCPRWNRLQPWFELVGGFKDAAQSARSTIYTVLA